MRLLKIDSHEPPSLTKNLVKEIPKYAILSHTWALNDEEEVTFHDLKDGYGKTKAGYSKIQFCGEQAQRDRQQYVWVDTCCIDKANHTELAEAIASMFRWYRDAEKCYVYLSDVSIGIDKHNMTERTWELDFRNSKWFTRGWTLQELLAPKSVDFFSREGAWLGDRVTLEQAIHETTKIPIMALRGVPLSNFSIEERMRWAAKRNTTKPEDRAYCLLGIFDVFMSPIYGEGDHAFIRLQNKIDKLSGKRVGGDKVPSAQGMNQVWHVPFGRLSGFVGRANELGRLQRQVSDSSGCGIVSILGLGGVGKSRLALELAYQFKSMHPQYMILWIDAAEQLTYEKDVLEIGKKLGIPGIEDEKADIKILFKQRLGQLSAERWLLILDNADNEALWGKPSNTGSVGSTLVQHLPKTMNGSIIVTTRTRRVANFLAGKEVIELQEMSPTEGFGMFSEALERPDLAADDATTFSLLEKLAYLPLAIIQAASFINMTQRPVQTYLKLLDQPEEEVIRLLSEDFGDPTRYPNAANPVATTWLISFDHIRKHHPLAAKLLSSMACLHEKNIPRSLLPEASSEMDYINAIAILMGYSFVRKLGESSEMTDREEYYDIHRLVQLSARNWLNMEGSLFDWTTACIVRATEVFPTDEHRNRSIWTVYLPHVERLCGDNRVQNLPERYLLLEKMVLCLVIDGKYEEAVEAQTKVVQWRESYLQTSEEQLLQAYSTLGEALYLKGDVLVAEAYIQKALERQKQILGEECQSTLISMVNLAYSYSTQGRWEDAEKLLVQVVETSKRVLGAEHRYTLMSTAHLASTYHGQRRWKDAEELEVLVLETSKRVLGAEHPNTLTYTANLASTYGDQGRWKDAEELEVLVLETSKRVLGAEHPNTLIYISNLATTYRNQGRWEDAEELEVLVLETSKRVLGPEHPLTLTYLKNLALTLKAQNRKDEAVELMRSCYELRIKVFGPTHYRTQKALRFLQAWTNTDGITASGRIGS